MKVLGNLCKRRAMRKDLLLYQLHAQTTLYITLTKQNPFCTSCSSKTQRCPGLDGLTVDLRLSCIGKQVSKSSPKEISKGDVDDAPCALALQSFGEETRDLVCYPRRDRGQLRL
jgi:hypothetical protein